MKRWSGCYDDKLKFGISLGVVLEYRLWWSLEVGNVFLYSFLFYDFWYRGLELVLRIEVWNSFGVGKLVKEEDFL